MRDASRPIIEPAAVHPIAIPTTAPVLSPLPVTGAGTAVDDMLVTWTSGTREVKMVEVEGVWRRLELDPG